MQHYDAHGRSEWACGGDFDCVDVDVEPSCVDGYTHTWRGTTRSLGGTTLLYASRCVLCGCEREITEYGSQRNPGQCDQLRFKNASCELQDTPEARTEARRQRRNAQARTRRRKKKIATPRVDNVTQALHNQTT